MKEGTKKIRSYDENVPIKRELSVHRQLFPAAMIGTDSPIDHGAGGEREI